MTTRRLCLPLLLLAACTPQMDMRAASYAAAKPTIAKLADADFAPLALPSKTAFEIDASGPAFDFGAEGVSYFRAFELPRADRPYTIIVASYMWNLAKRPSGNGVFYQTVATLDREKRPIGTIKPSAASWVLQTHLPPHRDIVLKLRPDMGARYIVVYTTRTLIAQSNHAKTVRDGVSFEDEIETARMAGISVGSLSVEVKEMGR